ncbi:unnamed protein product [Arabis nemorensis]|uniref:Uncharacterized protein n=1 Tax=Arabis nemorensis TaxID=586526 RepID=A0A565BD81_9BRAS|nr:unnamed protein product [Arabis nemorensis]
MSSTSRAYRCRERGGRCRDEAPMSPVDFGSGVPTSKAWHRCQKSERSGAKRSDVVRCHRDSHIPIPRRDAVPMWRHGADVNRVLAPMSITGLVRSPAAEKLGRWAERYDEDGPKQHWTKPTNEQPTQPRKNGN